MLEISVPFQDVSAFILLALSTPFIGCGELMAWHWNGSRIYFGIPVVGGYVKQGRGKPIVRGMSNVKTEYKGKTCRHV